MFMMMMMMMKYVCITTFQPDTKSNPNANSNPNPTTKQHAMVNIQLNIVVTCPMYPEKFLRDNVVAPRVRTSLFTVALPQRWVYSIRLSLHFHTLTHFCHIMHTSNMAAWFNDVNAS